MSFKIGDRVRIRQDSRYYGADIANPARTCGKLITIYTDDRRDDHTIRVEWRGGVVNAYRPTDLELVIKKEVRNG